MSLLSSRLRVLCLHTPNELQLPSRAFHSKRTREPRYGTKSRNPEGEYGGRARPGSISGPPVSGRRKLVNLKELEPNSRTGGRLEVARDMPPHYSRTSDTGERRPRQPYLDSRGSPHSTDRGQDARTYRKSRGPPRIDDKFPSHRDAESASSSSPQPFYKPQEQLNYASSLSSPEFQNPPTLVSTGSSTGIANNLKDTPKSFAGTSLLPGFRSSLQDMLGENAKPTPIQSLSLKWVLDYNKDQERPFEWGQWLLASETGSGKSFAYLLPLLQGVKETENSSPPQPIETSSDLRLNPRAIILAPTHELSRQISSFAKTLLHSVKLRVVCASQGNTETRRASSREMANEFGEPEAAAAKLRPVDLVVGTPMKIMDMVRGRWWDLKGGELGGTGRDLDRGFASRKKTAGKPEMGLANVEWVVIDEADVLLDPDFQEVTRTLLADISAARGYPVQLDPFPFSSAAPSTAVATPSSPSPGAVASTANPNASLLEYPFNFLLTSATIPASISRYLDLYHPRLLRLASPRLHKLPEALSVEYVKWTGGNRFVDVERRVREVWAADAVAAGGRRTDGAAVPELSKIIVFCNKSTKVQELSGYLGEKGIKNIAVTSGREDRNRKDKKGRSEEDEVAGASRTRGSNKYLEAFLKPIGAKKRAVDSVQEPPAKTAKSNPYMLSDPSSTPHVVITTSLLSRGLDFDPSIQHVFIVDEPRNMIDFLHRAGRSGRTGGQGGKVVVFGRSGVEKGQGRGRKGSAYEGKGALLGRSLGGAIVRKGALNKFAGGGEGRKRF